MYLCVYQEVTKSRRYLVDNYSVNFVLVPMSTILEFIAKLIMIMYWYIYNFPRFYVTEFELNAPT